VALLAFAGASASVAGDEAPPSGGGARPAAATAPAIRREIRVRVAVDEEFGRWYSADFRSRAQRPVEEASAAFERRFGIRWRVVDFVNWKSFDEAEDLRELLWYAEQEVPATDVDMVVAWTGQTHAPGGPSEYDTAGQARYFGRTVIVRLFDGDPPMDWYAAEVAHELGHVFGAWHCTGRRSIMGHERELLAPLEFDPQAAAVIELNRDFDFARGAKWLDDARRERIAAIFRSGHYSDMPPPHVSVDLHTAWRLEEESGLIAASRRAYRRALAQQEACCDPSDPVLLWCLVPLARSLLYRSGGDVEEAHRLASRALQCVIEYDTPGARYPDPERLMADVEWTRGRRDVAIQHYRASCDALVARRRPDDPDIAAAKERLHVALCAAFETDGTPAWTETTWRVVAPLRPTPELTFDAPQPGNVHVRRAPLAADPGRPQPDAASETLTVAAAAPGLLTLRLEEHDGTATRLTRHAVSARIPAAATGAPSAVAAVSFVPSGRFGESDCVDYAVTLTIRPATEGADRSVESFRCMAPGCAALCVERMPIIGEQGFLRLPCGGSGLRDRLWVGRGGNAAIRFTSDRNAVVDGVPFSSDGAGTQRTWRLEMTFVPDE
jgi:hypothetical protein